MSTSRVLSPRRANAAARFTAVVVFPQPPFCLTIARTRPTLLLRRRRGSREVPGPEFGAVPRFQRDQRFTRVFNPAVGLAAGRRGREKRLQVFDCRVALPSPHMHEGEPIVRSGQGRFEAETLAITLDRFL